MKDKKITLAHGSGGKLMHDLVEDIIAKRFKNPMIDPLNDSATFDLPAERVAFTTDTYVVKPLFFNGGDIGKLAVCGTVNDLAMSGATPKYISCGLVIEEGFLISSLEKILNSMVKTAKQSGVQVVTGDTKVVERGNADGLFINTSGVGVIPDKMDVSSSNLEPGDKVIISGSVGDHGIAIVSQREGIEFQTDLKSDCAPLNQLVQDMIKASKNIKAMRDPTRGGLASTLNEFAQSSNVGILVEDDKIPVKEEVFGACEMLGYDHLHVACEGRLVAVVSNKDAEKVVDAMCKNPLGKETAIIGEVTEENKGKVLLKTIVGTTRILDMLVGEQLPRIC